MDSPSEKSCKPIVRFEDELMLALSDAWEGGGSPALLDKSLLCEPAIESYFRLEPGYEKLEQFALLVDRIYGLGAIKWQLSKDENGLLKMTYNADPEFGSCAPGLELIEKRLREVSAFPCQRVFVYGAGTHTLTIWPLLQKYFKRVDGVLDRNPRDSVFQGPELLDIADFNPRYGDLVILSSMSYESEMRASLVERFGTGLKIVGLYNRSEWESFEKGLRDEDIDANQLFDEYLDWLNDCDYQREINASGYVLEVQRKLGFAFLGNAKSTQNVVDERVRAFFTNKLVGIWKASALSALGEVAPDEKLCWFDCYALGDYLMLPVIDLTKTLLESGLDRVVLFVSDRATLALLPSELDRRITVVKLIAPAASKYIFKNEDSELFEKVRSDFESAPKELKRYFDELEGNLLGELGLSCIYGDILEWLYRLSVPRLFVNLQDNRVLSRSFHCRMFDRNITTVQLQHGVLSSSLGPFWSDLYLGWKDPHSANVLARFGRRDSEFFPLGNYNCNRLSAMAKKMSSVPDRRDKRLLVFFMQGPAFWHVTFYMVKHVLEMLLEALPRIREEWDFAVKLRKPTGSSFLCDLFSERKVDGEIEIIDSGEDNLKVFSRADIVGVISTSAYQEADLFGLPWVSLESREREGIVRLSDWGAELYAQDAGELVEVLRKIGGADRSVGLLVEKNSQIKVLSEDKEALSVRLRHFLK